MHAFTSGILIPTSCRRYGHASFRKTKIIIEVKSTMVAQLYSNDDDSCNGTESHSGAPPATVQ
jgi:hypothetical protein